MANIAEMAELQAQALPTIKSRVRSDRRTCIFHVAIILASGAAFRLIYQIAYRPFWSGDSSDYTDMFYLWARHTYSTAKRTPVYALFLGLVQRLAGDAPSHSGMGVPSQYLAVRLQSLLGLLAALLVYFSLRALAVRPKLALAGGICFAWVGGICLFEMFVLSELLSLFFLMVGTWFFLCCMRAVNNRTGIASLALLGGVCFGLAILTRPENLVFFVAITFVLVAIAVRCWYLPSMKWAAGPLTKVALLLAVSTAPLVLCWMTWNLVSFGQFRINTLNGLTSTESTYNMFNLVDTDDRVVGAVMWRSYLLKNGDGHIYRHHVWFALPILEQAWRNGLLPIASPRMHLSENAWVIEARNWLGRQLGINEQVRVFQPVDLWDYVGHVSWKLAKKYPSLYVHNVLDNFASDTFDYSIPPPSPSEIEDPRAPEGGSVVRNSALYTVTVWINRLEAPLLTASYVVLLSYILFSPLVLLGRDREHLLRDGAVVALAMGAFATILCSCVFAAYYPQHGVPFMGVLVICVVFAVSNVRRIVQFWAPLHAECEPEEAASRSKERESLQNCA